MYNDKQKEKIKKLIGKIKGQKRYSRLLGQLNKAIMNNKDLDIILNNSFSRPQLIQILSGINAGVDVSVYAYSKFTPSRMKEIRYALEHNMDTSEFLNPELKVSEILRLRLKKQEKMLEELIG